MKKLFFALCFCCLTLSFSNFPATVCTCFYINSTLCGSLSSIGLLAEIVNINREHYSLVYELEVLDAENNFAIGERIEILAGSAGSCIVGVDGKVGEQYFFNLVETYLPDVEQSYQLRGCGLRPLRYEQDSLFGAILPEINKMSYNDFKANYENCINTPSHIYANIGIAFWKNSIQIDSVVGEINGFEQVAYIGQDFALQFPYAILENAYEIAPLTLTSNDEPKRGISTADLLCVQKHILGQTPITNPYQALAADVNLSGNISTFDLIQMRKLLLGRIDSFPHGHSWLFLRSDTSLNTPTWVASESNRASGIEIQDIYPSSSVIFTAVKLGDVDGNIE